jgi:hypothetical protein
MIATTLPGVALEVGTDAGIDHPLSLRALQPLRAGLIPNAKGTVPFLIQYQWHSRPCDRSFIHVGAAVSDWFW